ncbi:MarR family transcriptional regulator [Heliorestis acidaminivorans]|uniref:MarR family transcriptional regulator n=1 Tax=Heliorestis acidaminivorans TaxID=553427 RepID=A0A6I0ERD0_9FIRM|nr:MarR family transcriptional regulator [Heliorestis acidaminivorans]KAB2951200.1 MarR family transcriptional regulator [Heliorestis acidaminivorans]
MDLEREFQRTLHDFNELMMQNMSKMSQKTSLTHTQFLLIYHISHRGLALQKDMRKLFHLTQGALSTALKDLEQKGFITRTQSPVDQREWVIALSTEGEDLLKKVSLSAFSPMQEPMIQEPEEAKKFIEALQWFNKCFDKDKDKHKDSEAKGSSGT